MIDLIRARQGEIAIVLAPDNPTAQELAQEYRLQGAVDLPVSSRSLIPVLERSLKDVYEALPQTARLPSTDTQDDTVNIESLVERGTWTRPFYEHEGCRFQPGGEQEPSWDDLKEMWAPWNDD